VTRNIDGAAHVLLTRRGIDPYKDYWDVPGGYLENGERPEEGLAREMREELGVETRILDLFASDLAEYPREDVAEEARFVLVLFYRCELVGNDPLIAGDDVVEARWFALSSMPTLLAFESNRRALALLASLASH
jgi:8-oxo-dGTP diphosphatase